MVTSLTEAAPRAPATHCPDFISAKSPLLFGPIPHTISAPKAPNLSVSLKSRLFGTTVMLRPALSKNDLLSGAKLFKDRMEESLDRFHLDYLD